MSSARMITVPSSQSAPGYLWVLSEPGKEATVEEFNDWYDNEHVPLRMQHIPEFLTGARYVASDSLKPAYSAAYDIATVGLFSHPSYTHLRANRSPREGALVVRLETLDRRTCERLEQTSPPPTNVEDTPKYVLTVADDDKNVLDGLRGFEGVKGWRRSHSHDVYDSLKTGHGNQPQANVSPKFVVIHEFDDESYVDSTALTKLTEGKKEVRRWKLYKATPNTASTSSE